MIKVFCTFFILFHHYQQVYETVAETSFPWQVNFWSGNFYWGYMVEFFFLISGYCMLSYIKKIEDGLTFYQFYARRAARLLPLMAVSGAVIWGLFLIYKELYGRELPGSGTAFFSIMLQSLGIQDGWGFINPMLNNPTWYCSVLLLCYIVFYFIVYWSNRILVSPIYGFVFFLLLGCGIQTYKLNLPFFNLSTCRGYYSFFAGVILALIMPIIQKWRGAPWASVVAILLFAREYYFKGGQVGYMQFALTFTLYPAIVVLLRCSPLSKITSLPFWGNWAKISYSVFIWHTPVYLVMYIVLAVLHIEVSTVANMRTMLLCAVVLQFVGAASYHFIETPLNNKLLSWLTSLDPAKKAETN